MTQSSRSGVLLDVDGTLVDTNYLHTIAWARALADLGEWAPMHAIHRLVGMGGDQLVPELLGHPVDGASDAWRRRYDEIAEEARAFPGAAELVRALRELDLVVVVATSAPADLLEQHLDVVGVRDLVDAVTTADDVDASKPAPEVFVAAMEAGSIDPARAIAVGDSIWDVRAARAAGIGCIGVETGGFSRHELTEDGALAVYRDVAELTAQLRTSPIGHLVGGRSASAVSSTRERPKERALTTTPDSEAGAGPATIGDCALYEDGRRAPGLLALDDAGEAARTTDGFVWIGLQQPDASDIAAVAERFHLPALAVEDAIKAHQRPKLEQYDDVTFVVLKPVRYIDHEEVVDVSEIALFLGPNFVVSVRHGESDVLHTVRAELDAGSDLFGHGPGAVLYRAADLVVDGYEATIESMNEDVDEIEAQVFGPSDGAHAERIYKLKREIAEFRRAVVPLAAALEQLVDGRVPNVDESTAPFFRDVHDHVMRAIDAIEGYDRLLIDVLQANLARLTVRQNEDMRKISAWAAIGLLPTAVAGIYGMNFRHMPELGWRYSYFIVVALIALACYALYRNFRRKGWL